MRAPDGTTYTLSKLHAFAILSNHPRSSKDRSLRVQTMSRFVNLQLNAAEMQRFNAEPETL